jgi:hypothetical protein
VCEEFWDGKKNGNEHKQWCEELDGDEDENWGVVWFT